MSVPVNADRYGTDLEEGSVSLPLQLNEATPNIPLVPRVFMYIFAVLVLLLGFAQIGGVVEDDARESEGDWWYKAYLFVPIIGVLVPFAIGICGIVAASIAKPHTISAWTVLHWCSLVFMAFLIPFLVKMDFVISIGIISAAIAMELAFSITSTVVCFVEW